MESWKDLIFYTEHDFLSCRKCDSMLIKYIETGDWIESSSLRCISHVFGQSSNQGLRGRKSSSI